MITKPIVVKLLLFVCLISTVFSCINPKELQYLQGPFDTASISRLTVSEPLVQKGDILSIVVFSDNEASARPFNQEASVSQEAQSANSSALINSAASAAQSHSYLVDINGNITFPVIGLVKVEGLSKNTLTELLNEKLSKYLSNPYYNIRFLNFKITLIGEVTRPGVYNIPNEKVNVLEAIGLAGDLTFFGKRDNVLVIRETNGKREFGRLDLKSPDLFKSPYYNLQQNDIILIDMSKRKVAANDQVAFRNISLVSGVISAIAVLVSVLR